MSKLVKVLVGLLLVVVVVVGAGIWWFLRDDAPEEVDLADAIASVSTTTGTGAGTGTGAATTPVAIDGSWTVDTTSGAFDVDSATGTFAGFRIAEELAGVGSTTAVGRTGDVTGSIEIAGDALTAATFAVDVTTITTNDRRRDDQVQRALDTGTNPTATFVLTEPVSLPAGAADGQPVSLTALGDLTISGVTRPVSFPLEAQLVDRTVVVVGSIDLVFSDYDVVVPDSQIVLSVADEGTLELQLLLVQA